MPHPEQAYIIRPIGSSGLVVAGLDDKGIYYGIQTLRQLLTARLTKTAVIVPLVTVTDWPDFEERGLWNSGLSSPTQLPWLAGMKLNFEHINHPLDFDPDAPRCPPLPMQHIREARKRAFHIMPHCWHYDFWSNSPEMRKNYTELVGKKELARNPSTRANPGYHPEARCPCASSPLLRKLLAEWMESAAKQGIRELSLWLTEYQPSTCGCDQCVGEGSHQLVRETRESIHAVQDAQRKYPDLVARLFITFNVANPDEEAACREALAMVPTQETIRVEAVYLLQRPFDDYARAGNWVSNYGIAAALGNSYRSRGALRLQINPDPEKFRERVAHLHDAGYEGLYNPSSVNAGGEEKGEVERHLCDFHVSMLAEWFWNVKGREAADFIRAWVTSRRDAQIEETVRWIEEMLPIESAVLLAMNDLADMADAVRNDDALQLGKAPGLAEFLDEESFEERIWAAERCGALAEEMGQADMEAESRCVASQLKLLREIYCLSRAAAERDEEKKAEHLREVSTQIAGVVAAARAQTRAWRTMPVSAAEKLDEFTEEFWRGAIASSV